MKTRIENITIIFLCHLCLVLALYADELRFQLEIAPLKYEIQKCLNSEEAVALEKWTNNLRVAINEEQIYDYNLIKEE